MHNYFVFAFVAIFAAAMLYYNAINAIRRFLAGATTRPTPTPVQSPAQDRTETLPTHVNALRMNVGRRKRHSPAEPLYGQMDGDRLVRAYHKTIRGRHEVS